MKKILSFFAFAALAISMVACGNEADENIPPQPVDQMGNPALGYYCTVCYYDVTENGEIVETSMEYCNMELVEGEYGYDLYGLVNLPVYFIGDYDSKAKTITFNGDFYQVDKSGNKTQTLNIWDSLFYSVEGLQDIVNALESQGYYDAAASYREMMNQGFSYVVYVIETFSDPENMPEDFEDFVLSYTKNENDEKVLMLDTYFYDNAYLASTTPDGYLDQMAYLMTMSFINRGTYFMSGYIDQEGNLVPNSTRSVMNLYNFDLTNNYLKLGAFDANTSRFIGKKLF